LAQWEQFEKEENKKKKDKMKESLDTHRPSHGRPYAEAIAEKLVQLPLKGTFELLRN
jgi:hypothetical protein